MSTNQITVAFVVNLPQDLREWFNGQLSQLPGVTAKYADSEEPEHVIELAKDADMVVGWRCPPGLLEEAKGLKLWFFPGVGVQRLIEPFKQINRERRVVLANGRSNTYATAQHSVALLLALMNKVVVHHNWMADGQWRKGDDDAVSLTMRDRKVGLLGYGGVNSKVHQFLSGFDVEFAVLRKHWEKADTPELRTVKRYNEDQLEWFLKYIDILMVAVPETPESNGLIGADELAWLGRNGLVVNIARGPVIDEDALYTALSSKTIAGAGIDVWYDYRPEPEEDGRKYPYNHPFHELDNIVLSPHRGASPVFAPYRWEEVADAIRRFAAGEQLPHVVNLEEGY